jgi:hypothetical protein
MVQSELFTHSIPDTSSNSLGSLYTTFGSSLSEEQKDKDNVAMAAIEKVVNFMTVYFSANLVNYEL